LWWWWRREESEDKDENVGVEVVLGERGKKFVDLMTGLTRRDYPKPSFAATTIPHTSSPKPPPL
jgi:hypothetical protein